MHAYFLCPACRDLHDKYVRLGERMEALVKEGEILKTCASAESGAARTAVQASRARRLLLDPAA